MVDTRQEPSRTHGPKAPTPAMVGRPPGTTRDTAPFRNPPATVLIPPTPTPPHTRASSNHMADQLNTDGNRSSSSHPTAATEARTTTPTEDTTRAATLPNSPPMARATVAPRTPTVDGTRMVTASSRPLRHQCTVNHQTTPMATISTEITTLTDMARAPFRHRRSKTTNTVATPSQATPLATPGELNQPSNTRLTSGTTKLPKP